MQVFLTFLLTTLIFLGCDGTYDNGSAESEQAFSVSMAPAFASGAATDVIPVNAQLILHASTALESSTVNENSVYIQSRSGIRQPATVTLIAQDIIIQPKIYLDPDTEYEIIVTTTVLNTRGQHLAVNSISSFTSGGTSTDTTGPTLITTLPLDKAGNVEPYSIIYFQFSESISPLSIPIDIIKVYDNNLNYVPGKVVINGSLFSFTPDANLTDGVNYTAEVNTSTITDLAQQPYIGNILESMNFTIGATANVMHLPKALPYPVNTIINSITATDSAIYIGGNNGLSVLTYARDTATFTSKAHLSVSQVGIVYNIDVNSSTKRAYLSSSTGFSIVDISDINNPLLKSHYFTLNLNGRVVPVYGSEITSGHAYLAATTLGIIDLDISDELSPKKNFISDTDGTAFDVIKTGSTLVVSDYGQGVKMFDLNGAVLTPPSPQVLGQDRTLFSILTTDGFGNPSYDYYVAAGIGGIKYWDSVNGIGLPAFTAASYVSKIIPVKQSGIAYAAVKGVGIAKTSGWSIQSYQLLSSDITSIGYSDYTSNPDILFAADVDGLLHAYEVQE